MRWFLLGFLTAALLLFLTFLSLPYIYTNPDHALDTKPIVEDPAIDHGFDGGIHTDEPAPKYLDDTKP